MPNVQRDMMPPENERRLRDLANSADLTIQRRARLILRWHAGDTQAEISDSLSMSISGVYHWIKEYRENGMAIFGAANDALDRKEAAAVPVPAPEPEPVTPPVVEAPAKPKKGSKAKPVADTTAAVAPEPVAVPAAPEPEPPPIAEPAAAAKPKRSSPTKKAAPAAEPPPAPEPVPEPVAEPVPTVTAKNATKAAPKATAKAAPKAAPKTAATAKAAPKAAPKTAAKAAPKAEVQVEAKKKPARPTKTATATHAAVVIEALVEPIPEPEPIPPPPEPPKPVPTVRGLIEFYGVYLKHAQHVAAQAAYLFDATAETHRLPDSARRVLEASALLHNVAYRSDPETHQAVGRDIIQNTPLEGFNADERTMIALLTAFHRGRVHPETEPLYRDLPAELQDDTLALAALLRIADGTDRSQAQVTDVVEAHTEPGELVIRVHGDYDRDGKISDNTEADVQCLIDKSDLWERLYNQRLRVQVVSDDELAANLPGSRALNTLTVPPALRDLMPDLTIMLDPAVSSGWAFRQLALHYAGRLDRLVARVRSGELNKLPALTRELERLNGALRLAQVTKFDSELAWLANKSHTAQTALALVDRAAALASDLEESYALQISAGLPTWQQHAQFALEALELDRAAVVIADLRHDLSLDPVEDADLAGPVGARVGLIVWQYLAELRESVERGDSVYKALTAAYRLQDSLLYFRSVLGPEATQALDLLTPFESYLTTIYGVQSTLVALEHKRLPIETPEAKAVEALEIGQNGMLEELADSLPTLWASVNSAQFRRALALALSVA